MRVVLLGVAGMGLVIAAGAAWWQGNEPVLEQATSPESVAFPEQPGLPGMTEMESAPEPMIEIIGDRHVPVPGDARVAQSNDPSLVPVPSEEAVSALRNSMENGDPRTPPLARSEDLRDMPSAAELADPDLYQQYEQRQNQKVYASFASAATQKISELEKMIARAEAEGLPPEQIQEGREKLEGLRNQRAEILQAHPDVAEAIQSESDGTAGQE